MRVQVNLSVDIETAKQIEEMKKRGFVVSHLFSKIVNEFAKSGYKYPINYDPKQVI